MARLFARSPINQRAYSYRPHQRGKNMTIISAMNYQGVFASMTIEGYIDGDVFLAYIEHILLPELSPGQVVVLDNLSCHKVKGVVSKIESVGAKVLYLPPYSPEFSPIELCWSKVKSFLRFVKAPDFETLETAIRFALKDISPSDALGWFKHCGYLVHSN